MIELDNEKPVFAPAARFERIAQAQPDALAVAQGPLRWTYGDVLEASGRYMQVLSQQSVGSEVALVFGHNAEALIAMVGAIRAGVLCVPIDPLAPPFGVEDILSKCRLVVTEADHISWCRQNAGDTPVLDGPQVAAAISEGMQAAPPREIPSENPVTVYFSSGTQGVPKGTFRTPNQLERAVTRLMNVHGYSPADRQALLASFAFAGSGTIFPGGLLTGGSIDIIDLRNKNTLDFANQVRNRGITILTMTSSLLRTLVDTLPGAQTDWQPRMINISGEPLQTQDIIRMRDKLGWTCKIVHRLACSEIGIIAEWDVDLDLCDPDGIVPAGYPTPDRGFTFVDDDGNALPPGHTGELIVTGRNLSGGYWKRPDLTRDTYDNLSTTETPGLMRYRSGDLGSVNANGLLEIAGRKGGMVKIRGYSVDKDAVEAAMRRLEGVVNAMVVVHPGRNDNDFLLGYVQQGRRAAVKSHAVRNALRDALPQFMVPKRIVVLDDLPLTPGGKIDHRKLPAPGRSRPLGMDPVVAPVGASERLMARIWSEVLEIDEISRHDDFFDIGGDSLDALKVSMVLQEECGIEIDDSELFLSTDLASMAERFEMAISNGRAASSG